MKNFIKPAKKLKILAPKKIHYTRANPDPNPATIVDDPERILRQPKIVETQASSSRLVRVNSLPEELSTLEEIPFNLSLDLSLFRSKYENAIHEIVLDPEFEKLIESKKIINSDLYKFTVDTFDKIESWASKLISNIGDLTFNNLLKQLPLLLLPLKFLHKLHSL